MTNANTPNLVFKQYYLQCLSHVSLPALLRRIDEFDKNSPTIVFCAGGYRSSIASSLLKSRGFKDVSDLIGGYQAWQRAKTESPQLN